jgi:hypothetical protein
MSSEEVPFPDLRIDSLHPLHGFRCEVIHQLVRLGVVVESVAVPLENTAALKLLRDG